LGREALDHIFEDGIPNTVITSRRRYRFDIAGLPELEVAAMYEMTEILCRGATD